MGYNFTTIEKKWQKHWLENKTFRALEPGEARGMKKSYVLDMFPYPSGAGLHVGHVENYTATDIVARFQRMTGLNVLYAMGWDAFGLPAEQYAIKMNRHPKEFIASNIEKFREQIRMMGLSYDWDREIDTTDPSYYKWTQWGFLQMFNSYFDPIEEKAKPIEHLMQELVSENLLVAPDGSLHMNRTQEGMERISGEVRIERLWRELSPDERREVIDNQRLAYMEEAPVNWCPALGTVLSNEEVIDGKSEVGGFSVERRPLRQWMLRITAYAERLLKDLDLLAWPESLKEMQRNWIGKSVGAEVDFDIAGETAGVEGEPDVITVFTTRPDTLYGATYMVLAPEHPLVDSLTMPDKRADVAAYRASIASKSDRDRMADAKEKTGVFTGGYAVNPVNDEKIPVYIADYVLMGYGTGAIMAVPAHDERDFEFAKKYNIPIRAVVIPPDDWFNISGSRDLAKLMAKSKADPAEIADAMTKEGFPTTGDDVKDFVARTISVNNSIAAHGKEAKDRFLAGKIERAFTGEGIAINSEIINGLPTPEAKERITAMLNREGTGKGSVKYKLRDWLFSRQRYWGEPFPIVLDSSGNAHAITEKELPLRLPDMEDFKPTGTPEPPLSKAKDWLGVESDSQVFTRETNTMPQWAGSCWYYLRYIDPRNDTRFVDPQKEKYWMPVDLYVGGVEHAVLHLLYARFWHKVLYDRGHVSTPEPFMRLVNQGLILGEMEYHTFQTASGQMVSLADARDVQEEATEAGVAMIAMHRKTGEKLKGRRVSEEEVEKVGEGMRLKSNPDIRVDARSFKMSKSRGNVANPDDLVRDYGVDALRLYVMYMGPLEQQKPWSTRDIIGMVRFLNGVWRTLVGDEESGKVAKIADAPIPEAIDRQMHRTIKKVADDIANLRFNVAIAELIKLNNEMGKLDTIPKKLAENLALMLAPLAPHIAEEVWQRLGHAKSLAREPWPTVDASKLLESTMELPVQVNGKLRGRVTVPADALEEAILKEAEASAEVRPWIEGKNVRKRLYVPKKLVNFVVG